MPTVTFTISNGLAAELNTIAQAAGFANAKAMLVAHIKSLIRDYRIAQDIRTKQVMAAADAEAGLDSVS